MTGLNIGGKTQGFANEFAYESDGGSGALILHAQLQAKKLISMDLQVFSIRQGRHGGKLCKPVFPIRCKLPRSMLIWALDIGRKPCRRRCLSECRHLADIVYHTLRNCVHR